MCDPEDLCFNLIDHSWAGVAVEAVVATYSFVGIAIVADEHLAPALETLCARLKLSEDVAGASFLALGSAAPEIIISTISTVKMIADVGTKALPEKQFKFCRDVLNGYALVRASRATMEMPSLVVGLEELTSAF